jgi:trehalose/maltose hydrolase-like predicted phosphorylase
VTFWGGCVAANVVSADEYAINVTDSAYTNAICALSLQARLRAECP